MVPAETYLENFASDRSHMLDKVRREPVYIAPPPKTPSIQGQKAKEKGINNNLMSDFVDMKQESYGRVMDLEEFVQWCD
jgi:hypothetical protein